MASTEISSDSKLALDIELRNQEPDVWGVYGEVGDVRIAGSGRSPDMLFVEVTLLTDPHRTHLGSVALRRNPDGSWDGAEEVGAKIASYRDQQG